ncbi:hypothetical protein FA95DRAFT_1604735 [Auriscalpium vulgare]|uniref:Uncharacterized protein n=1 Tax=Auriscalpium vulgare TaxID=40419 RepID=A0ACB8RYZ7_9AGAM|nr:hypothetical protein FA95DRAFT_1604735 [Auriscalpium vulgare]
MLKSSAQLTTPAAEAPPAPAGPLPVMRNSTHDHEKASGSQRATHTDDETAVEDNVSDATPSGPPAKKRRVQRTSTLPRETYCSTCQKSFNRTYDLQRHLKKSAAHNGTKYSCEYCGKTLSRPDAVWRHQKTNDRCQRLQAQEEARKRKSEGRGSEREDDGTIAGDDVPIPKVDEAEARTTHQVVRPLRTARWSEEEDAGSTSDESQSEGGRGADILGGSEAARGSTRRSASESDSEEIDELDDSDDDDTVNR